MISEGKSLVLDRVDIVQLIGRTVALKRRGKDYVGLCPFHNEKTPSFHVSPEKRIFHCFGCKKNGNAIDFVIERDRLDFKAALHQLADEVGVELPKPGRSDGMTKDVKAQLYDACSTAAAWFRKNLLSPSATIANDYLLKRGFNDATLQSFGVGLAVDAWEALLSSAEMKKFSPEILHQAGLAKSRDAREGEADSLRPTGFYDVFRGRIMFPIKDESGKVIAFGGRILPGSDSPAKYLNSPETPLFHKSKQVYGIDLAKKRIADTRVAVIVEGYTDVLMAHQFGMTNVVSVLGTALTEQHVTLLKRFADKLVLLFDADAAGAGAADRSLELFLSQPIEIAIATLPEGKDPDEVFLEQGRDAMEQIVAKATPAMDYLWTRLRQQVGDTSDNITAQAAAIDQFARRMQLARQAGGIIDSIRWNAALIRASKLTGLPVESLQKMLKVSPKPRFKRAEARPTSGENGSPGAENGSIQHGDQGSKNVNSQSADTAGNFPLKTPNFLSPDHELAQRWILGLILNEPSCWNVVQLKVTLLDFQSEGCRQLAEKIWEIYRNEGELSLDELIDLLDPMLRTLAIETAHQIRLYEDHSRLLADAIGFFSQQKQREQQRKLVSHLSAASSSKDEAAEVDLLKQLQEQAKRTDLKRAGR